MKTRQKKILNILNEKKDFVTGKELSRMLEVSDRTIRSDIGLINSELNGLIEASVRYGYRLKDDISELEAIRENNSNPQTLEERCNFILNKLFTSKKINLIDLQYEIFYSEFTIRNDIKRIQKLLEKYDDLAIVENGDIIYLQGSEESKRLLYKNMLINETKGDFININKIAQLFPNFDLIKVQGVLEEILNEYNYKLRSETIPMLMIHVGVGIQRMMDFNYVDFANDKAGIDQTIEYEIAKKFFLKISTFIRCEISENEIILLARLLMGRQNNYFINDINLLDNSNLLLDKIITGIKQAYNVDFSNDEFFKDGLLIHLQHLLKRLDNHSTVSNIYLHEIKKNYPLVFEVSVFISKIIEDFTKMPMIEDEIGFLAIHLGAAYDRLNIQKHYYHVVLIQPNNQVMTSICLEKINNRFKDRIKIDGVLRFYEENTIKRLKPDFIITTVNISHTLDIPTIMVSMFFNDNDEYKLFRLINDLDHKRQALEFNACVGNLVTDEFFFKNLECDTYKEVIDYMCDALYRANRVDDTFKNSTFEREKMAWTSLSYGYAIPHPLNYSTIKSTIAIASLKKPVQWGKYKVKFVMLLAIKEDDKDFLRIFFDWFSNVCDDQVFLSKMMTAKNIDELLQLMME